MTSFDQRRFLIIHGNPYLLSRVTIDRMQYLLHFSSIVFSKKYGSRSFVGQVAMSKQSELEWQEHQD